MLGRSSGSFPRRVRQSLAAMRRAQAHASVRRHRGCGLSTGTHRAVRCAFLIWGKMRRTVVPCPLSVSISTLPPDSAANRCSICKRCLAPSSGDVVTNVPGAAPTPVSNTEISTVGGGRDRGVVSTARRTPFAATWIIMASYGNIRLGGLRERSAAQSAAWRGNNLHETEIHHARSIGVHTPA